ncbi:MAG: enoyl-CoA hydratase-related protein [Endozoicomonadaceae bacterium]|nr:enoyl-CoA hydratase-related protein [Endozoicomonadaceae bacterium]
MKNGNKNNKEAQFIKHKCDHATYELHLCRPEKKNAINTAMYQELAETILSLEDQPAVKVLIITGSHGNFTSGNDLKDFMTSVNSSTDATPILSFMNALKNFSKPVIAAVEGFAIGIGTTLLLHCDLVYAKQDVIFKLPFVSLGLCPEYASSLLLPAIAGYAKASEWLLLGKAFSAEEALAAGMINRITDNPLALSRETAKEIEQLPPRAVQRTKALLKQAMHAKVDEVMYKEAELFSTALTEKEFITAATRFLKK